MHTINTEVYGVPVESEEWQTERTACLQQTKANIEALGCDIQNPKTFPDKLQYICIHNDIKLSSEMQEQCLSDKRILAILKTNFPLNDQFNSLCLQLIQQKNSPEKTPKESENGLLAFQNEAQKNTKDKATTEDNETQDREIQDQNREIQDKHIKKKEAMFTQIITQMPKGNLESLQADFEDYVRTNFPEIHQEIILTYGQEEFDKHRKNLQAVESVLSPDELQNVFGGNLSQTVSLDLSGSSNAVIYADVFDQIDQKVTDPEKRANLKTRVAEKLDIKQNLSVNLQTGSQIQDTTKQKESYIDPHTGEMVEKYRYTEDNLLMKEGAGFGTYMTKDGRMMMRLQDDKTGRFDKDITGWMGEDVGLLAEAMNFHSFAEKNGITGLVESIARLNFNFISDDGFSRPKIIEVQQIIGALTGRFNAYDGEVFYTEEKAHLLKNQFSVFSPNGELIPWYNDQSQTLETLQKLGIHNKDRQIDMEILQEFGAYTQGYIHRVSQDQVWTHLYKKFPQRVEKPQWVE